MSPSAGPRGVGRELAFAFVEFAAVVGLELVGFEHDALEHEVERVEPGRNA